MKQSEITKIAETELDNDRIELGVGGVIKEDGDYIFVLSKEEYWKQDSEITELSFQNVGGAIEENETTTEALKREVKEELNSKIAIKNSDQTHHFKNNEFKEISLETEKKPYIIYEEWHKGKPGSPEAEGEWKLIGFLYEIKLKETPQPSSEIPAYIKIPEKLLNKSQNGLTSQQIEKEGKIKTQRPLPNKFKAKPKFSAQKLTQKINKNEETRCPNDS